MEEVTPSAKAGINGELSRKFWFGKNIGPGDQYSRKCSENIGPSLKIWVRLATVSGKSAKIVFSGAVVSVNMYAKGWQVSVARTIAL